MRVLIKSGMDVLLDRAVEFHGHLGPFLVIGLRMGLIGLRELKAKNGEEKMRVTSLLDYVVPFSCAVDGLQIATKCTIGNKKLRIENSSEIAAKFELGKNKTVIVTLNSDFFDMLRKNLPSKSIHSEETQKLANLVVSTPEKRLFTISKG